MSDKRPGSLALLDDLIRSLGDKVDNRSHRARLAARLAGTVVDTGARVQQSPLGDRESKDVREDEKDGENDEGEQERGQEKGQLEGVAEAPGEDACRAIVGHQSLQIVPEHMREQALKASVAHWDRFYKHNSTHAFADRHYILDELPHLATALGIRGKLETTVSDSSCSSDIPIDGPSEHSTRSAVTLLEVGCGVGNALLPLVRDHPMLHVRALAAQGGRWHICVHTQVPP
jgi:hypothetical protein